MGQAPDSGPKEAVLNFSPNVLSPIAGETVEVRAIITANFLPTQVSFDVLLTDYNDTDVTITTPIDMSIGDFTKEFDDTDWIGESIFTFQSLYAKDSGEFFIRATIKGSGQGDIISTTVCPVNAIDQVYIDFTHLAEDNIYTLDEQNAVFVPCSVFIKDSGADTLIPIADYPIKFHLITNFDHVKIDPTITEQDIGIYGGLSLGLIRGAPLDFTGEIRVRAYIEGYEFIHTDIVVDVIVIGSEIVITPLGVSSFSVFPHSETKRKFKISGNTSYPITIEGNGSNGITIDTIDDTDILLSDGEAEIELMLTVGEESGTIDITATPGGLDTTSTTTLAVDVLPVINQSIEKNPVIQENGILRVLPGNIKGGDGLWHGYIDRIYFGGKYKPESKFYFYKTAIDMFSGGIESITENNNAGDKGHVAGNQYYKIAQIFDGNQRSLLNGAFKVQYVLGTSPSVYNRFKVSIDTTVLNKRLTELEIYRSSSPHAGYGRILNLPVSDTNKMNSVIGTTGEDPDTATSFTGEVKDHTTIYPLYNGDVYPYEFTFPNASSSVRAWSFAFKSQVDGSNVFNTEFNGKYRKDHYFQKMFFSSDGTIRVNTDYWSKVGANHWEYYTNNAKLRFAKKTSLFDEPIKVHHYYYNAGMQMLPDPMIPHEFRVFMGKDVIRLTESETTIIAYDEDFLVGKYITYDGISRQIVRSKGRFIQVESPFANEISGTFNITKTASDVTYGQTGNLLEIEFNDINAPVVGSHPLEGEVSIEVNGKHAIMLNGRLFQGDIVLDPHGIKEVRPYWVSYSELAQPDVNPVSNVIQFLDKEGGAITGLSSLYGRLVVLKQQGMFIVSCDANQTPDKWTSRESIHNIGNIAQEGYISVGDRLYVVFHDGIYKLSANSMAETDSTPTEQLKITDPIQDVFDDIYDKTDVHSIYDQYNDEILFKWHRSPKNLIKNGDFKAGINHWTINSEAGGSLEIDGTGFKCQIVADGAKNQPGVAIATDFMPIDPNKNYVYSVDMSVSGDNPDGFRTQYWYYNKNKEPLNNLSNLKYGAEEVLKQYSVSTTPAEAGYPQARYVKLASYFWTAVGTTEPNATAVVDNFQIEENAGLSTWIDFEDSQEIWAYNVSTKQWREIKVNGHVAIFTHDENANVIFLDDRGHKVRSFRIKDNVEASLMTHPMSLTSDRSEIVRQLTSKIKSDDALAISLIPDGKTAVTREFSAQSRATLEKQRFKTRCKDIQLSVVAGTGDAEIHYLELEYS
jgi:hypothetical protein